LHGWNRIEKFQQRTPKLRNKAAVSKSGKPMMPE
jgi:hypothetical protein